MERLDFFRLCPCYVLVAFISVALYGAAPKWIEITREQDSVIWAQEQDGVTTERQKVWCMGVPDHPTLTLSSFIDKPTPPHTLCRAMPPITTQGALAKAGLGEQLDGVWVFLGSSTPASTTPVPLLPTPPS